MSVYTTLDKSKLRAGIANKTLADDIFTKLDQSDQVVGVTITSAQLLALNATEQTLVAAPGANKTLVFKGLMVVKPAGTAYAGVAAGEDFTVRYTDESGLQVGDLETTGFVDQTTKQVRWIYPEPDVDITPVENSPLVFHLSTGEITTGDSDLVFEVFYKVVDTSGT